MIQEEIYRIITRPDLRTGSKFTIFRNKSFVERVQNQRNYILCLSNEADQNNACVNYLVAGKLLSADMDISRAYSIFLHCSSSGLLTEYSRTDLVLNFNLI